jgi:crotonobetainyl-CoA:carnitine CoA-transferase CaiB-like acyl-CoA transferase
MLGLQNEREWQLFCDKVLLQPALAQDPRFAGNAQRSANRDLLRELVMLVFAGLTARQVGQRLEDAQIANGELKDVAGLWAHPQLAARQRWRHVATPAGDVPALLPPGSWDDGDPQLGAVPALGQHTQAILAGLGLDEAEIQTLRDAKAL